MLRLRTRKEFVANLATIDTSVRSETVVALVNKHLVLSHIHRIQVPVVRGTPLALNSFLKTTNLSSKAFIIDLSGLEMSPWNSAFESTFADITTIAVTTLNTLSNMNTTRSFESWR